MSQFNNSDIHRVMLVSSAGSKGLNLSRAHIVILLVSDFEHLFVLS